LKISNEDYNGINHPYKIKYVFRTEQARVTVKLGLELDWGIGLGKPLPMAAHTYEMNRLLGYAAVQDEFI